MLAAKRDWQSAHPDSNFTLNFVAQKRHPDRHLVLRGRVLTERGPDGTTTHTIAGADEFVATLAERFRIDEPRAREIWPRVVARHGELFEEAPDLSSGTGGSLVFTGTDDDPETLKTLAEMGFKDGSAISAVVTLRPSGGSW